MFLTISLRQLFLFIAGPLALQCLRVHQFSKMTMSFLKIIPLSSHWLANDEDAPESATALVGEMKILIPLAGLIDKDAELARLDKEIGKLQVNVDKTTAKLVNKNFVDKAPHAVVEKERERLAEMTKSIEQLQEQAEKIKKL